MAEEGGSFRRLAESSLTEYKAIGLQPGATYLFRCEPPGGVAGARLSTCFGFKKMYLFPAWLSGRRAARTRPWSVQEHVLGVLRHGQRESPILGELPNFRRLVDACCEFVRLSTNPPPPH
jgi:hypothetical protein